MRVFTDSMRSFSKVYESFKVISQVSQNEPGIFSGFCRFRRGFEGVLRRVFYLLGPAWWLGVRVMCLAEMYFWLEHLRSTSPPLWLPAPHHG